MLGRDGVTPSRQGAKIFNLIEDGRAVSWRAWRLGVKIAPTSHHTGEVSLEGSRSSALRKQVPSDARTLTRFQSHPRALFPFLFP